MHNRISIISTAGGVSTPLVFTNTPALGTGVWAGCQVADGADGRSAQNLQALALGTAANLDFIAARTVNWLDGGAYTWTTNVTMSNYFTLLNQLTVDPRARGGNLYGLQVYGQGTAPAIDAYSGLGGNPAIATRGIPGSFSHGIDATGDGDVPAAQLNAGNYTVSGAANNGSGLIRLTFASTSGLGTGVVGTVENSTIPGANGQWTITVVDATHIDLQSSTWSSAGGGDGDFVKFGTPAARLHNGPAFVDTNNGPTLAPPANTMAADQIPKGWSRMLTAGSGSSSVAVHGVNISAVCEVHGSNAYVKCSFLTAMGDAFPGLTSIPTFNPGTVDWLQVFVANGGPDSVPGPSGSVFYLGLMASADFNTWVQADPRAAIWDIHIHIAGKQ